MTEKLLGNAIFCYSLLAFNSLFFSSLHNTGLNKTRSLIDSSSDYWALGKTTYSRHLVLCKLLIS